MGLNDSNCTICIKNNVTLQCAHIRAEKGEGGGVYKECVREEEVCERDRSVEEVDKRGRGG